MYDLYMFRYQTWTVQCAADGVTPSTTKTAIQEANSVYTSAKTYTWLLVSQCILVIMAILINFFRKEKACKRKTHRLCASVRFLLSLGAAIWIMVCLFSIKASVGDENLIYLASHTCTND